MLSVQQFLTKNGMAPVPHPSNSPDLTPSDLFVFPQMKESLQRETFCQCGRGETKMAEALKGIKIDKVQKLC